MRVRRWFQFNLRTLLLLQGTICVALAIKIYQANRETQAVASIQRDFGRVVFDFQETGVNSFDDRASSRVPQWLRDILGTCFFHHVVYVVLDSSKVTDDTLTQLDKLPALRNLYIANANISKMGMHRIGDLQALRVVIINLSGFDDQRFSELATLGQLEQLDITDSEITDNSVVHLKRMVSLKKLYLDGSKMSPAGLEAVRKALPACEIEN